MSDDRIDRLAAVVDKLTTTVGLIHDDLLELARTNAAEHAEYRQDIRRLYSAFTEHYREHGSET